MDKMNTNGDTLAMDATDAKAKVSMDRNYKRELIEFVVEKIFFFCAFISVISVIAIIGFVFYKGLRPFFCEDSYSFAKFISGIRWAPSESVYGIFYMIVASVFSTAGAVLVGKNLSISCLRALFPAQYSLVPPPPISSFLVEAIKNREPP